MLRRILVLLCLVLFSWTSPAENLARRYGYEKQFNTGTFDQLKASYNQLNKQLDRALKKNDGVQVARLSALAAENLKVMGAYTMAVECAEQSLEWFTSMIEKPEYQDSLLLRYDYAATLSLMGELIFDTAADSRQAIDYFEKSSNEYGICMNRALDRRLEGFGLDRVNYSILRIYDMLWNATLLSHSYVYAVESVGSYMDSVDRLYGPDKHNHIEYMYGLFMKATMSFRTEDYEDAVKYFQSAIECSESVLGPRSLMKGKILIELAGVYLKLNDVEKSFAYYQKAMDLFHELEMVIHPVYAELLSGFAMLYITLRRFDEAEDLLETAYDALVESCGKENIRVCYNRILNVNIHIARKDYLKAMEELKTNIRKIHYFGDDTILHAIGLKIDLARILKKEDEVLAEEKDFLQMFKALDNPSAIERYKIYIALARTYEGLRKTSKSCEYFSHALDLQRQMVHKNFLFLPERQRTWLWERDGSRYNSIMKHCLHIRQGESSSSALVYDAALLQKGLLLEASVNLARIIDEKGTPQLKEKMRRLRLLMMSTPDEQNTKEAQALEVELLKEAGQLGDFVRYADTTWEDVRDALSDNDVAIEFVCVDDNGEQVYTAEVLRKGMQYPYHLEIIRGEAEFEWTAILPLLRPGDNVYFSPAGKLHKEGVEYMTLPEGQRMDEKYNMCRVSSTRELLRKGESDAYEHSIALYGGLNYSASRDDMEMASMLSSKRGEQEGQQSGRSLWSYLPGTEKEITGISTLMQDSDYKCVTVSGDYGVEESFKDISGKRFGIIHVATHGFYFQSDNNVLSHSGLIFSGANNSWLEWSGNDASVVNANDGVLTSAEIADMDLLGTDLVVLSACNTGQGTVSGEGVFGLQRAFKKAGARSLLVSLTEVDDEVTNRFMVSFYRHLTGGCSKREALRKAQDEIRDSDWKSFILID